MANINTLTQRGLSLIESAMVLALAAIVVSGVLFYFESTRDNEGINEAANTIGNVVATVNKYYQANGRSKPYTGLTSEFIAKTLPGITLWEGKIQLPLGVSLDVVSATDPRYSYQLNLSNVPRDKCMNYVTILLRQGAILKGWTKMQGGGAWLAYNGTPTEIKNMMMNACHFKDGTEKILLSVALAA